MTKKFIKKRNDIAKIYFKELKDTGLILPIINKSCLHVFHLFVVYHPSRNIIINHLKKKNINIVIHYPLPLHKMKPYKKFVDSYYASLPVSEKMSKGIFSLPIYPEMNIDSVIMICNEIKKVI